MGYQHHKLEAATRLLQSVLLRLRLHVLSVHNSTAQPRQVSSMIKILPSSRKAREIKCRGSNNDPAQIEDKEGEEEKGYL